MDKILHKNDLCKIVASSCASRDLGTMIDFTRKGTRCSAKRMIRSHAGTVGPLSQGTVAYEMEDMGRQLILVRWDVGMSTHVFAEEIEINECSESTESCKSILEPLS